MWTDFFDRIVVINLPKRLDRLLEVTEEMEKYGIDFELVDGITSELGGAEGLRLTVEKIFKESIEKGHRNILIFEDDTLFLCDPTNTMELVVKELPENYDICYLSAQATCGFHYRQSASLLQLDGAFATHSWAVSLQAMKDILAIGMDAPIDNFLVRELQNRQRCYITYPILTTQREGYSNIGCAYISWRPFLEGRYDQKLAEMK